MRVFLFVCVCMCFRVGFPLLKFQSAAIVGGSVCFTVFAAPAVRVVHQLNWNEA